MLIPLGIPDSHIILMVADDVACSERNPFPGRVYSGDSLNKNVYGTHVEVDYRGYEVTGETFFRLLTGRESLRHRGLRTCPLSIFGLLESLTNQKRDEKL